MLLPLAVAAVWLGGWYFSLFVALLAAAMGWEWSTLCGAGAGARILVIVTAFATPVVVLTGGAGAALACVVLGIGAAWLVARRDGRGESTLLAAGAVYIGLSILAATWLRVAYGDGLIAFMWVLAIVVATDIGAYAVGRVVGGPKLAPRISPGKTWSGLAGGMACAALVGPVAARLSAGGAEAAMLALLGAGLAVAAQAGDLLESAAKRHFGVKDASALIPGHGGMLDRLDGFLTVAPLVALMMWIAGENLLKWQ